MAIIRPYKISDYVYVQSLLLSNGWVEVPPPEVFESVGLVADVDGKIVGFVWALCNSHAAFIDYFCVHPDHRAKRDSSGYGALAIKLVMGMVLLLNKIGVRMIYGTTAADEQGESLARIYSQTGMTVKKCSYQVVGKAETILKRFAERREEKEREAALLKGREDGQQNHAEN